MLLVVGVIFAADPTKGTDYLKHATHEGPVYPDKYLNEQIFHNQKNGVYIEIGVLCPTTCSTAHFFDKYLHWNGVCLDGRESSHIATINSDRTCDSQHGILCSHDGKEEFWSIEGPGSGYSGIASMLSHKHKKLILKNERERVWNVTREHVMCVQLETLVNKFSKVDLLAVDIEGAELAIFPHINFSAIAIDVIIVETDNPKLISSTLANHNYHRKGRVGYDYVYMHQSFHTQDKKI